ncbi:hypothetical protein BD779DRAFT_1782550 [Infundibulicybe gibba]|nr:hypothetical protein BD779DRAFT_1782550 [Infundibulicybe gibba]
MGNRRGEINVNGSISPGGANLDANPGSVYNGYKKYGNEALGERIHTSRAGWNGHGRQVGIWGQSSTGPLNTKPSARFPFPIETCSGSWKSDIALNIAGCHFFHIGDSIFSGRVSRMLMYQRGPGYGGADNFVIMLKYMKGCARSGRPTESRSSRLLRDGLLVLSLEAT